MTEKRLEYAEELQVTSLKGVNNFKVNLLDAKNASTMVTYNLHQPGGLTQSSFRDS
jgi:hypothetical protein